MKIRLSPLGIVGAIVGILLFIYTLQASGPSQILDGIRRIGFAFVLVLALSGVRMALRAKAWSLCVEENEHFGFGQALRAFITGDAVGNVTPLGPIASESTKAMLSRQSLSMSGAFSSVVLENMFYSLSVAVMVAVGTIAFLLGFRPTDAALTLTIAVSAVAVIGVVAVWWLLYSQPRLLSRFLNNDAVRDAEDRIFRFAAAQKGRTSRIMLLEFAFHLVAVSEIYVLIAILVGHSERTLLVALVLETVERLITIAFKFVPFRLGVDQAGSGMMAQILGLGTSTGVIIATTRTARNLIWAAVGLVLLTTSSRRQPASPDPA